MSVVKIILIGCAVLVINNLLLLNFIGYFSDQNEAKQDPIPSSKGQVRDSRNTEQILPKAVTQNVDSKGDLSEQASAASIDEVRMIDLLRNVAETDDFIAIFDDYQAKAGRRYLELQKEFGSMDAVDLYDVVANAESDRDRQFALQVLTQTGFGELETYQLKSILNLDDLQGWHKGKLLSNLLERRDPGALGLAKEYMSANTANWYIDQDLVRNVYDLDPGYIQGLVNDFDLDKRPETFTVLSVALEDPEIAKEFYTKNIDQIIESKNSQLFNYLSSPSKIDLSVNQQNKIVDLLQSPNRQKRRFAMGMLSSIESLDTIRNAFKNIERISEKRNFIYSIVSNANEPERKQLAKELAASTEDPALQKMFK